MANLKKLVFEINGKEIELTYEEAIDLYNEIRRIMPLQDHLLIPPIEPIRYGDTGSNPLRFYETICTNLPYIENT